MRIIDEQLFSPDSITVANTSSYSKSFDFRHILGASVAITYTGSSLQGSIVPQASLDNVTFFDLPNSGTTTTHTIVASGSSAQWNMVDFFFPYYRLKVTSTDADTVTISGRLFAKGV